MSQEALSPVKELIALAVRKEHFEEDYSKEFEEYLVENLKVNLGLGCTSFNDIDECEELEKRLRATQSNEPEKIVRITKESIKKYKERKKKKQMIEVVAD